ncbi:MAG: hypothetical protein KHX03_00595 [Clostridium sp.]|nr:hypothetical protein [Clostridium sp.]
MDKKQEHKICNGYESSYMFLNDTDFHQHLKECESCRKEHEKLEKVSALIKEAKPYIKAKQKRNKILKAVCALALLCFTSFSIPLMMNADKIYDDIIAMNSPTIEEMGLPVDEYGFLLVE